MTRLEKRDRGSRPGIKSETETIKPRLKNRGRDSRTEVEAREPRSRLEKRGRDSKTEVETREPRLKNRSRDSQNPDKISDRDRDSQNPDKISIREPRLSSITIKPLTYFKLDFGDIGELLKVRVEIDGTGSSPDYFLNFVEFKVKFILICTVIK